MSSAAVVNSSPLIYLAQAGLFHLLKIAGAPVFIPGVVSEEILRRGKSDVTARAIEAADWLELVEVQGLPPEILSWNLGPGESSGLAWALANPGCRAVIDDLEGRRCAESLGVPLRGTLGLVLRARRQGVIDEARPVVEKLRVAGMYLSDRVMDAALAEVGE
jgi:predicted nucleic acid-binding protein